MLVPSAIGNQASGGNEQGMMQAKKRAFFILSLYHFLQ
jgi:hypothetical protein